MKYIFTVLSLIIIFMPQLAGAQGFVTCGGEGDPCNFCDLVEMGNKILSFIIQLAVIIAVIVLAVAGVKLASSRGNTAALGEAKQRLLDIVIGIFIVAIAFTVVDVFLKMTMGGDLGVWNEIQVEDCGGELASGVAVYKMNISPESVAALRDDMINGVTVVRNEDGEIEIIQGDGTVSTYVGGDVGTGNIGIVQFARQQMARGCQYDQSYRNGCLGTPAYTDCSDLVHFAYRSAGCRSPGTYTGNQIRSAVSIGDPSTLRAGDALIYRSGGKGHVVICTGAGCSQVIHASGRRDDIKISNGSYYINHSGIKVIRASNFCN